MSDQSGDASGGIPQPSVGANSPFMSGQGPPSSFTSDAPVTFGAPASQIAATSPPAGVGGSAVSAPGATTPVAAPAGFAGVGGSEPPPGTGGNAFTDSTVGNQVFAMNQPTISAGGGASGAPSAPAAGGGAPGAGGQPTNSVLNAIQNPGFNSIMNAIGGNLGPLASLGILGFEAANKPGGIGGSGQQLPAAAQPGPVAGALVNTAQNLQGQGQALAQPLATGVLPAGAQSAVDQVTQEQEAQIRQQFASMGLSGSSMEASAIANAQQAAEARGFAIAQQMAQQGLSDLQLSSGIFGDLLRSGLQSDQDFQQALTQFASSIAGGGGGGGKVAAA